MATCDRSQGEYIARRFVKPSARIVEAQNPKRGVRPYGSD